MANKIGNKMDYKFYNEDQKKAYIEYIKQQEIKLPMNYLERMFTATCETEEDFKQDVSLFKKTDIEEMYRRISFSSLDTARNFHSQLRRYTNWCLGQARTMECVNHYAEQYNLLEYVNPKAFRRKMISREELIEKCYKLDNPCDQFALLAIFEGINGKEKCELVNMRLTDFNEDNTVNIVRDVIIDKVTGKKERRIVPVKISEKLRNFAMESAEMKKYIVYSGRAYILQDDPELIIKNFRSCRDDSSDLQKGRRLFFRLNKCLDNIGLSYLSLNGISDSGKISLMNEIAARENLTGKEVLYHPGLLEEVNQQFNTSVSRSTFYKKYKENLIGYNGKDDGKEE